MLESLEPRTLFSVNTSSVALYDANGNPATINRHLATWIVVHGDAMTHDLMNDMASAVQKQLPAGQWQVLVVDWSKLAVGNSTSSNAIAVGDRLASMINAAHLPASRVNLIGFSMGGAVVGEIASDLKTKTTQVNRIIGVDPRAANHSASNFAANSAYSIAFCGKDSLGGEAGSLSADDAVLLTGLSSVDLQRHADVFTVVTTMWMNDAHEITSGDQSVDEMFSIPNILTGPTPTWKKNAFSGYEAVMPCGEQNGISFDLGPNSLTYLTTRSHTRVLS